MKIADLRETDSYDDGDSTPEQLAAEERAYQMHRLENAMETQYFKAYANAGIPLDREPGQIGPVIINFDEDDNIVELSVTTSDSFPLQALILLSEQNLILPTTEIMPGSDYTIRIETKFPAANTPFRKFMNGAS